jgi:hypothetical protein
MQKQIWKLSGNIAQPFKGMCLDFLPKLSVFVPYPQHKTIIENLENFAHFGKPELPIIVYPATYLGFELYGNVL